MERGGGGLRPYKDKTSVSSLIKKTEEGRKLIHDPKTYQISQLKNVNFYTFFVVNIFSVCLFSNFVCILIYHRVRDGDIR